MKARTGRRTIEIPDQRVRAEGRSVNEQAPAPYGALAAPAPASARIPSPRTIFRSKLEQAYADYLHTLFLAGEIRMYRYEPIRFTLAPNTTLTPDFQVILSDGTMEFRETKGFCRDDAMAKLKICARMYPEWKFWLVKRKRGVWEHKELPV